jgi:hypothetical protein
MCFSACCACIAVAAAAMAAWWCPDLRLHLRFVQHLTASKDGQCPAATALEGYPHLTETVLLLLGRCCIVGTDIMVLLLGEDRYHTQC